MGILTNLPGKRCNTQMLRSSHKEMFLSLTIISCVAATTHKFVNNVLAYVGINNILKVEQIGNSNSGHFCKWDLISNDKGSKKGETNRT